MAGHSPLKDDIILTRGADFVSRYDTLPTDPEIPDGASARIEITADRDSESPIIATWVSDEVTARYIRFRIESDEADLIPARYRYRLMVRYPEVPEDLDHCWFVGSIRREQ